jgi:predicted nucleic acid-binding protein
VILDAAAALDPLTYEGDRGECVAQQLVGEDVLDAPHLIDVEVLSGLRKRVLRRELSAGVAGIAVTRLRELRMRRYSAADLLDRIWQLRSRLTPYDASYVALAETLGAPLVTTDARLARARGHRARILAFDR